MVGQKPSTPTDIPKATSDRFHTPAEPFGPILGLLWAQSATKTNRKALPHMLSRPSGSPCLFHIRSAVRLRRGSCTGLTPNWSADREVALSLYSCVHPWRHFIKDVNSRAPLYVIWLGCQTLKHTVVYPITEIVWQTSSQDSTTIHIANTVKDPSYNVS